MVGRGIDEVRVDEVRKGFQGTHCKLFCHVILEKGLLPVLSQG